VLLSSIRRGTDEFGARGGRNLLRPLQGRRYTTSTDTTARRPNGRGKVAAPSWTLCLLRHPTTIRETSDWRSRWLARRAGPRSLSQSRQKATPSRIRAIASAGRRRPRDRAPRFDATVDHRPLDAPDAGLKEVRIERTAERPAFGSGQEMWDWVLYGNPIPGMLVADLEEEQQATIRQVQRNAPRALRRERASRPDEHGQHRYRDQVTPLKSSDGRRSMLRGLQTPAARSSWFRRFSGGEDPTSTSLAGSARSYQSGQQK